MSVVTPRHAAFAASGVAVAALAVGAWVALAPAAPGDFAECRQTTVAAASDAFGGPFELTDHTGVRVSEAEVFDGPTLLYFGYTWCPDVCPFDVARMAEATEILEEEMGLTVKPVFVTVDPERDDVASMSDFVQAHHPRMVGLTGAPEEIRAAASAWRVYYAKQGEAEEDYLVDHSTFTYLVDDAHGFLDVFRREAGSQELAERVACYLERS